MNDKDARIARDVAIDELKTTNKYEALAEAADSKKVGDVVRDIAREEKVHTGEAAALLDDADPEARPAMEEGAEEVRSFQESDQTYFSPYTGKLQTKPPKVGDAGEPHHTRWEDMSDEQKKRTDPERYERERRKHMKKSVGPSFAEMFANERGRVLEKTGMLTDEGLAEFRKSMVAKAGDFSISRDMYEYSPTRGKRLIEENVGTNWPMPGVSSDHLLNPRGGDQEYNEILHSSGRLHSPQQRDIALNHQPTGREGMTPEQSHNKREAKWQQNGRIEQQYLRGDIPVDHSDRPVDLDSLKSDLAVAEKRADKARAEERKNVAERIAARNNVRTEKPIAPQFKSRDSKSSNPAKERFADDRPAPKEPTQQMHDESRIGRQFRELYGDDDGEEADL